MSFQILLSRTPTSTSAKLYQKLYQTATTVRSKIVVRLPQFGNFWSFLSEIFGSKLDFSNLPFRLALRALFIVQFWKIDFLAENFTQKNLKIHQISKPGHNFWTHCVPSLSTGTFGFKFDGRPKDVLYKFTREEIKMCICGEFDCTEQLHISRLFPEARPTFEQYQSGLADPGVRTSAKNSVYEFKRNILTVQAVTENGENRQSTVSDFRKKP